MSKTVKLVSQSKCYGGLQCVYEHESSILKCTMKFGVYLPPQHEKKKNLPIVYYLSGLTCTEQNYIMKSGFQRYAAKHGIVVVNPDTSPRGFDLAGEHESYDFGSGAGFYVNATEEPWKTNYRMYSYVTGEMPTVVQSNFNVNVGRSAISGHSMGGHGALIAALRNPGKYKCCSVFAPISNPSECPWGTKAFSGYLGDNKSAWKQYDATFTAKEYDGPKLEILLDQGEDDPYLNDKQLLPENFANACSGNKLINLNFRMHPGYDHGYFFIMSFMEDHFNFMAKHIC
ncbi:S-formylglutathione hydrolase-like isoform X2 [Bolinopsis microptera]|uniref:S-formylglutathione hydrolase-like isoform X2 n=1 Tax=Bolinopsis microptera TaxID=2820187 RepID=UPI0030795AF0